MRLDIYSCLLFPNFNSQICDWEHLKVFSHQLPKEPWIPENSSSITRRENSYARILSSPTNKNKLVRCASLQSAVCICCTQDWFWKIVILSNVVITNNLHCNYESSMAQLIQHLTMKLMGSCSCLKFNTRIFFLLFSGKLPTYMLLAKNCRLTTNQSLNKWRRKGEGGID